MIAVQPRSPPPRAVDAAHQRRRQRVDAARRHRVEPYKIAAARAGRGQRLDAQTVPDLQGIWMKTPPERLKRYPPAPAVPGGPAARLRMTGIAAVSRFSNSHDNARLERRIAAASPRDRIAMPARRDEGAVTRARPRAARRVHDDELMRVVDVPESGRDCALAAPPPTVCHPPRSARAAAPAHRTATSTCLEEALMPRAGPAPTANRRRRSSPWTMRKACAK